MPETNLHLHLQDNLNKIPFKQNIYTITPKIISKMQPPSLLTTAALASTALASLQVNYYKDSGCSNFQKSIDVTWVNKPGNCYNYQYGTSVNVASCAHANCVCTFYPERDCQGGGAGASWYSDGYSDCLWDGHKYQSFDCYYNP